MDGMYRRCSQLTVRRGKYNKGLFITVTKFMTDSLAEMTEPECPSWVFSGFKQASQPITVSLNRARRLRPAGTDAGPGGVAATDPWERQTLTLIFPPEIPYDSQSSRAVRRLDSGLGNGNPFRCPVDAGGKRYLPSSSKDPRRGHFPHPPLIYLSLVVFAEYHVSVHHSSSIGLDASNALFHLDAYMQVRCGWLGLGDLGVLHDSADLTDSQVVMPAWSPASLERKGADMHKAQGRYACSCSAEISSLPVIVAIPNMRHLAAF
ncbi:hypothetical protein An03g04630 [Aspergillus niger]|uniref:Uncharacterized protein n=2 Tax=Aspergillus niger TaxID=5061 RepID=A2QGV5_ASPNC|nr:hypothetical protein An03g04630 [Aspergillus niger]CAK38255.1 hypothetical protein An03g04630 [Aspergillus niger]